MDLQVSSQKYLMDMHLNLVVQYMDLQVSSQKYLLDMHLDLVVQYMDLQVSLRGTCWTCT